MGSTSFTDYLDDDGIDPEPIPIQATLHVEGDGITVDFTGSGRQVRGSINCPMPFTKSAAYACVRCVMPTDIPNNEGHFRPIKVIAPAGTIVNPHRPAPVAARGLTGFRIANAVLGALAQAVPERVPAAEAGGDTGVSLAGYDAQGEPFVMLEFLFGSWGGRPFADGPDGVSSVVVNFANNPAEVIEAEHPIAIDRYEFVPDSGGRRAVPRGAGGRAALPDAGRTDDPEPAIGPADAGALRTAGWRSRSHLEQRAGAGRRAERAGGEGDHRAVAGRRVRAPHGGRRRMGSAGAAGAGGAGARPAGGEGHEAEVGRRPGTRALARIRVFSKKLLRRRAVAFVSAARRGPNRGVLGWARWGLGRVGGVGTRWFPGAVAYTSADSVH